MPTREETILSYLGAPARAANMVDDPEVLRLLDTSEIKIAVDGTVILPHRYFEGQRAAKPHLFKGYQTPAVPKGFNARTASKADYDATKRAYVTQAGRR